MYRTQAPESSHCTVDGVSFIRESGGIREYRLDSNGLTILFLRHGVLPVVTFMVTYRVGSRNETVGLTGATHFLEHLMFKGTAKFNRRAGTSVFEILQRVGAQVNATTWFDRTNYFEQMPASQLSLAVDIEADRMRGILLRGEDVEAERTVILNEFDRGENEPLHKLFHEVWATAFSAHPYGHPTIGWRSDIEAVTAADLRSFYDTYYYPDNATASVVGCIDEGQTLELIRSAFGGIERAPRPMPDVRTVEPAQRGERRVTVRMTGEVGAVMIAFKTGRQLDDTSIPLDVVATILADGKNSRLYGSLVDEGLASSVSAACAALRDPGLFYIYATCVPGITHESLETAITNQVTQLVDEPPSGAELRRARTLVAAQAAFARDGSFQIAAQLNEAIAVGDWTLYPTYIDRVNRVERDDVHRAARATFRVDQRTVGYYIPVRGEVDE